MKRITHYGITDLAYCGYLLAGFHAAAQAGKIEFEVVRSLPADMAEAAGGDPNMQMLPIFAAGQGSDQMRFCVDNHDKADYVHPELVRLVDLYFKANHDPQTLAALDLEPAVLRKVVPLGAPFAPLAVPAWLHRPPCRQLPAVGWDRRSMVRRARQLRRLPTIEYLRSLRTVPKTHDVSFQVRLYRQSHHSPINDFRSEVGRRLVSNDDIDARVVFLSSSTSLWEKMRPAALRPKEYLPLLATSRLGLYVWGAHRSLSFKLAEQLAIGLPVVGQTIPQDRANLAGLEGFADQFRYDDPAELVEAVAVAVNDPHRLAEQAERNAKVFDEFLGPERVADNIIDLVFGAERLV